jgi:magnesium transporter
MGIVSLSCCTAHLVNDSQHVEFGETHVFVGPRFVVSVRHGSLQPHIGLRARCEASKHLLAKGPGFVLYALMDFVVDQFFPILEALEEKVVELEEVVLDEKFIHETTNRIYHLKRELLSIKRAVSPLVDICSRLIGSIWLCCPKRPSHTNANSTIWGSTPSNLGRDS